MAAKTIFKRIIDGEIPAKIIYQDDLCLAFHDVAPQAPTHVLIIPKREIPSLDALSDEDETLAGHLILVARKIAKDLKLYGGYRIVCNCGPDAGQSVDHLHFHLLGGRALKVATRLAIIQPVKEFSMLRDYHSSELKTSSLRLLGSQIVVRRVLRVAVCCLTMSSLTVSIATADTPESIDQLRINQLQFVGTHNSYHIRPVASTVVAEWNYNHAPLDVQLDRGVRSFELDVHDKQGVFAVLHVPMLDDATTCPTLSEALATVRKWSDAHPRHLPISFLFELKKDNPLRDQRIKQVDAAGLDRLDDLLRAAFPPERRISPDDVRGQASTLREAIHTTGWPTVAASRGKVFFILHDDGPQRELYVKDHASLRGRAMFVRSDPEREDAACMVLDNPRSPQIPRRVAENMFVRTRADAGLTINPPGQPARRDAAFASGAQIVSTDFPTGESDSATGYVVAFPNSAPARINPINAPESLRGQTVSSE